MRLILYALALCLISAPAAAAVTVHINNATQRMIVSVNGTPTHSWAVSTARRGYRTPAGVYRVQRMARMWHSRKYNMSPMPHSLFFRGGYAIHGTGAIGNLGRPASHGCVRLHPRNASALYALVQRHGGARIVVSNGGGPAYASLKSGRKTMAALAVQARTYAVRKPAHRARAYAAARRSRHVRAYASARRPVYAPAQSYTASPWSTPYYTPTYSGGYSQPFGYWYR